MASRSARAMSPAPMAFPSKMAVPLATPKPSTVATLRRLAIMELAATKSSPRRPIITEYMEEPTANTHSFPRAGRE